MQSIFGVLDEKNTMVLRNTLVSENFEVFAYNKPCSFEKHDTAKTVAFWSYRNSTLDIFLQNSGFAYLWSLKTTTSKQDLSIIKVTILIIQVTR